MELASMQGGSAVLICGCVNAITGDFVFEQADIIVRGAQPIPFTRKHISREADNPDLCWKPCSHDMAISVSYGINLTLPQRLLIREPNGVTIEYLFSKFLGKGKKRTPINTPYGSQFERGISAYCYDHLGDRYHPKQNIVYEYGGFFVLKTTTGEERYYRRKKSVVDQGGGSATCYFDLDKERLSNGNLLTYKYEKTGLTKIKARTPSNKKKHTAL